MTLEDLRKKVFTYMGKQRLIFQIRGWTDKTFEKSKKAPRSGITMIINSRVRGAEGKHKQQAVSSRGKVRESKTPERAQRWR